MFFRKPCLDYVHMLKSYVQKNLLIQFYSFTLDVIDFKNL